MSTAGGVTTRGTPSVLALPGAGDALRARLAAGLERVEELITARVDHDDPFVAAASAHLTTAGGKRFRPLLTLLASELGSGVSDDVVAAAAGVELTHLASLYHDDVMDEADVRRGAPSANALYDNSTAILVGDLLFGTASDIVADLGPAAVKIQAQTFVRLCAGQIRDDRPCPPGEDPVEYYLGVLEDKTGVLIATAARYGAMFSRLRRGHRRDDARVRRAARHGLPAGRRPHRHRLGRRRDRQDPRHRPARGQAHPAGAPRAGLRGPRRRPAPGAARRRPHRRRRLEEALRLLRGHPAMERAREHAVAVASRAQEVLAPLPPSEARDALHALATGVVTRVG